MEEIKVSRPPDMPGVEVWSVKDSSRQCRIFHETYSICSLVQGGAGWLYRGKRLFSGSRNLMVMEPGELHVTDKVMRAGTYFLLELNPSFLEGLAREAGSRKSIHLKRAALNEAGPFRLFERFHRSLETSPETLKDDCLLTQGLHSLLQRCAETPLPEFKGVSSAALEMGRDFLLENWRKKLTLLEISRVSGLSRFHFLRAFAERFGLPPHAYQQQIRIAKARDLIKRGFSTKDLDLGYSDQSHFIRQFKDVIGVTPGEYGRMVRAPVSRPMAVD